MKGKIVSINISKQKGQKKTPVGRVVLIENFGIVGDAHAGTQERQVSLLSSKEIEKMRMLGIKINYGDFGENITADGIDISKIKTGDKVKINDAEFIVTQIGKECHSGCDIFKKVGYCIMPEYGIFMKVIKGGEIKTGDDIEIVKS